MKFVDSVVRLYIRLEKAVLHIVGLWAAVLVHPSMPTRTASDMDVQTFKTQRSTIMDSVLVNYPAEFPQLKI